MVACEGCCFDFEVSGLCMTYDCCMLPVNAVDSVLWLVVCGCLDFVLFCFSLGRFLHSLVGPA